MLRCALLLLLAASGALADSHRRLQGDSLAWPIRGPQGKNVLFIAADDMRPEISPYGHKYSEFTEPDDRHPACDVLCAVLCALLLNRAVVAGSAHAQHAVPRRRRLHLPPHVRAAGAVRALAHRAAHGPPAGPEPRLGHRPL